MSSFSRKQPVNNVICMVPLPDDVIRQRKSMRLGMMLLATIAYFVLTSISWAFMAPSAPEPEPTPPSASAPEPEPTPPSAPTPEPSQPSNPTPAPRSVGNVSSPNAGEDRERHSRKIRRSYRPVTRAPRAAITDQNYYGGKLGVPVGKAMSFVAAVPNPTSKPVREER